MKIRVKSDGKLVSVFLDDGQGGWLLATERGLRKNFTMDLTGDDLERFVDKRAKAKAAMKKSGCAGEQPPETAPGDGEPSMFDDDENPDDEVPGA